VVSFLKNLDKDPSGEARTSWLAFERALVQGKITTKYNTLIQKGFFPNKLEVEDQVNANNESVNMDFIVKTFADVKDEDITFNDADLKQYYEDNLYQFEQEESRNITYVTFDITPSKEDIKNTKEWLAKSKDEFANEKDPIRYINLNSDEVFVDTYYEYSPPIAEYIADRSILKSLVRAVLIPIVMIIEYPFIVIFLLLLYFYKIYKKSNYKRLELS